MSGQKPDYFLKPTADGSENDLPRIHALGATSSSGGMSRRRFIGSGIALSAILSTIDEAVAAPRAVRGTVFAHFGRVCNLSTSRNGRTLVSSSDDGTVKFWNLPGGALNKVFDDFNSPVLAACLSADGRDLLAGLNAKQAIVRAVDAPKNPLDLKVGGATTFNCFAPVVAVRFSEDGARVAAFCADRSLFLWDRASGDRIGIIKSRDEVITAMGDWNVPGMLQQVLRDNADKITAFHLAPDALRLVYAAGKHIGVWNLPSGDLLKVIDQPKRDLRLLAVATQAPVLAYLTVDNAISIVNLEKPDHPILIKTAPKWITSMAMTPDGSILATGHTDGIIILWSAETGDQLGFCFDPNCNWDEGKSYELSSVIYTLPCGTPIPSGSRCICNCVPGTAREFFLAIRQRQILTLQQKQWEEHQRLREDQARKSRPSAPSTTTTTRWICTCNLVYF